MKASRIILSRGRYSSMMDMGGIPSADSSKIIDLGRNNKVRAIALDFNLITRSLDAAKKEAKKMTSDSTGASSTKRLELKVEPRRDAIESIANFLGIKLGEGRNDTKKAVEVEDLSRLIGDDDNDGKAPKKKTSPLKNAIPNNDIRTKYASKLRKRMDGGLPGIDLANSKKEEALKRGDAAGHFLARSIAASETVTTSGSKWLASTGTGTLLTFLSKRSMKIALMPSPKVVSTDKKIKMKEDMESLSRQLPYINFDLLVEGRSKDGSGDDNIDDVSDSLLYQVTSEVGIDPISTLVVSDQDAYLRSARDMGCFTCRVRKKNAPRGNITTNYSAENMEEVQEGKFTKRQLYHEAVCSNSNNLETVLTID